MIKGFIFAAIVMVVLVASNPVMRTDGGKVEVRFFYESLCPYCQQYIEKSLKIASETKVFFYFIFFRISGRSVISSSIHMVMLEELKMELVGHSLVNMEQENVKEISLKLVHSTKQTITHKLFPLSFVLKVTLKIGQLVAKNVQLNTVLIGMSFIHVPLVKKVLIFWFNLQKQLKLYNLLISMFHGLWLMELTLQALNLQLFQTWSDTYVQFTQAVKKLLLANDANLCIIIHYFLYIQTNCKYSLSKNKPSTQKINAFNKSINQGYIFSFEFMLIFIKIVNQNSDNFIKMNANTKQSAHNRSNYHVYCFQQGQYTLFLYHNHTHPTRTKIKFTYGFIRLFSNDKMFTNQIVSVHHLNSGFEWDQKFFKGVLEAFKGFRVEPKIQVRMDIEGDQADKSQKEEVVDLQLLICYENEEIIEKYIKVTLIEDFGKDRLKEFWKQFANYNEYKNNQIQNKQKSNAELLQKRKQSLSKLVNFQEQCDKNKQILLGRLSAILREKINKLKEFGEQYSIQSFSDKYNEMQQAEPRILSTLQEEKAFMGSLFEPSQNFYH